MPATPKWLNQAGLGKESVWGTAVSPTAGIPDDAPDFEDKGFEGTVDHGNRGLPAMDHGVYPGPLHTEAGFNTLVYPDDSLHFVMAALGNDAITGAGPYTHGIAAAAARRPSYTLWDYTGLTAGGQARQYPGSYIETLDLKFVSDGTFTLAAKFQGKKSVIAAKPSETYSTGKVFLPWQHAFTINSIATNKLMEFALNIKCEVELAPAGGTSQDVVDIVPGRIEVTGTGALVGTDETELLLAYNNTITPISLVFTSGTDTLTLQMTTTKIIAGKPDRSGTFPKVMFGYRAYSNTTDVSSGGAASGPLKVIGVNGRSTVY